MMAHACNPDPQEEEEGEHKFKVTLGYTASLKPTWDI